MSGCVCREFEGKEEDVDLNHLTSDKCPALIVRIGDSTIVRINSSLLTHDNPTSTVYLIDAIKMISKAKQLRYRLEIEEDNERGISRIGNNESEDRKHSLDEVIEILKSFLNCKEKFCRHARAMLRDQSGPISADNAILVCCGIEQALRKAGYPAGKQKEEIINAFKRGCHSRNGLLKSKVRGRK